LQLTTLEVVVAPLNDIQTKPAEGLLCAPSAA
jgi:hypothetical protein